MAKVTVTEALKAVCTPTEEVVEAVADNMAAIKQAMTRDPKNADSVSQVVLALLNGQSNADKFVIISSLLVGLAGNRKDFTHGHAVILAAAMTAFHSLEAAIEAKKVADGGTIAPKAEDDAFAGIDTTKAN